MDGEDQATQGTPAADSDADAGHSEETTPADSGAAEDTQAGGPPEGETTEASSAEGHEAETTKPDRYGEEAYKTLQNNYTREREARLDLERRLAVLPAEQRPDERAQIQARLQELEAHLEVNAYDSTAQREAARLEARLEVMDRLGQQDQQQNFRTARDQGLAALKEKAPVLWAAEGSEDFPKAQELAGRMKAASRAHGLEGHPHEAYLAYAVAALDQQKGQLEAAKAQGALTESKRKEKVGQQGQLGGGKGGKATDLGLSAGQLQTAKNMGVRTETMARVVKGMKTNTGGMTVES